MRPNDKVLFGLGLEAGVHQVRQMVGHARLADNAGLDFVSLGDYPYFAARLDAYAALGFVLGATSNITGAVIMTNLLSRPAPILARTVTGLSTISGGRVILGVGRSPTDVGTIYIVSGRISRDPRPETRDDEGRWIGGGVRQWVEELTFAVLEHGAAAFVYMVRPGETITDTTLNLWAHDVVPAVREAVATH